MFFNGKANINNFEILIRNICPYDNYLHLNNKEYLCFILEIKHNTKYYVDLSNHFRFKDLNLKRSLLEIPDSQLQMPMWKLPKLTIEKIIGICYE